MQERRLEDVTKTLGGGEGKTSKGKKKQQQQQQQQTHNNSKGGNSSSSGSDSSDSSSSSSEESDSDSEPETKQDQNSAPNNLPKPNSGAPKISNNSGSSHQQLSKQQQQQPHNESSMLGNNLKVRNDLMPGGPMGGETTPNSLLLHQQQQQQQQYQPQNFPAGNLTQPPQQPQPVRQFNPSVVTTPQQSPTQLLQQQQHLAKMNAQGPLSHMSTASNSSNNEISSVDSPAGPQKTKAMLKGWSSLAGPGSAGTMGAGGPVPSMTGPVMPMQVNPAHHGMPAAVGPTPDHLNRMSSNVNKSQMLQQKASDTFNAFRKAAQEKTERERQLKEQQETVRRSKEAAERERKRQETERKREQAEEDMLEQVRRSMQMGRPGIPPNAIAAMDNGNGTSSGISPSGMSPVMTDAARAQLQRQREREKEQERRRREAKAGGIDMNMQSDLMAAFEENII